MPPENRDTKQGFLLAGGAYLLWGFLPFYMKALAHVPSWEVVAHRILWSIPLSLVILYFLGLLPGLKKAFSSPRTRHDGRADGVDHLGQLGRLCLGGRVGQGAGDGAGLLHQPAVFASSSPPCCSASG